MLKRSVLAARVGAMTLLDASAVVTLALLGTGHCVGMCGGLAALAAGSGASGWWPRYLAYLLGKSVAYATVGSVLWSFGFGLRGVVALEPFRTGLAWVTGGFLVVIGLEYALGWRWSASGFLARKAGGACNALRGLWWSRSPAKSFLLGWLNGFLPCGLSLSAILLLVRSGSLGGIWLGSGLFGLGTLPGLALATWGASKITPERRVKWVRVGGVFLVLVGAFTLLRGTPWLHPFLRAVFGENSLGAGDEWWCRP